MTPALDFPTPIAISHRGGPWEGTENSITAFRRSYDLGYRYLETDVRGSSDGVAVVMHDGDLARATGRQVQVRETPWSLLQALRINGCEPIMTLESLLEEFPDVTFNLDVKERAAIDPFVDVVRRTKAQERIVIASFSSRRMSAVRAALGPTVASSLSPPEVWGLLRRARGRRLSWSPPAAAACVQLPEFMGKRRLVDKALVATAHGLGLQVHVWTINDAPTMNRLLDLGVDGIMTDRPSLLKSVLTERGQWHGPA